MRMVNTPPSILPLSLIVLVFCEPSNACKLTSGNLSSASISSVVSFPSESSSSSYIPSIKKSLLHLCPGVKRSSQLKHEPLVQRSCISDGVSRRMFGGRGLIKFIEGFGGMFGVVGGVRRKSCTGGLLTSMVRSSKSLANPIAADKAIPREAKEYQLGQAEYYLVLVANAIIWQSYSLGVYGIVFRSSALFAGIYNSVLLPISEVLAVVCYHDKFGAEKGVALVLSLWGFASNFYGDIKQNKVQNDHITESEMTNPINQIQESEVIPPPDVP